MTDEAWNISDEETYFRYVLSSTVRQYLVSNLSTDDRSTTELIEQSEYSDSAIYNELGTLDQNGVVNRRASNRWELTGLGQLIADWTDIANQTEALIRLDERYWQNHDVSVVPRPFRQSISVLNGCEIVRSSETNPQTVQARVTDLLSTADSVDVMSGVQHPQYAQAIEERAAIASPRLIFDTDIVESADAGRYRQPEKWPDGVTLQVHDRIQFTLGIIDDSIVLSLPTLEGNYDMYTEIIATGEALDWGRDLFAHYLETAVPMQKYLEVN